MSDVKVSQIGHLAGAPELIMVPQGNERIARATMVVISNKRRKDKATGEILEKTTSVRWTLWREQAENAVKFLGKGSHVAISGRLENNNYDKDGETVYGYNYVATEIEYLDSKADAAARSARATAGEEQFDDVPQ